MDGCLRVDVMKSKDLRVFIDNASRDFTGNNVVKNSEFPR